MNSNDNDNTTVPLPPEAAAFPPASPDSGVSTPALAAPGEAPIGSPRTRWAGIIWGTVLAAVAGWALFVTLSEGMRRTLAHWWLSLDGVTGTAYTFLALGAIAVICAIIGVIGRAQRARALRLTEL